MRPERMEAGTEMPTINGTSGNDVLSGFAGDDEIYGFGGDDLLSGEGGVDVTVGGLGNDRHVVDNAADLAVELADEGNDTLITSVNYVLAPGVSIEILDMFAFAGAINLTGNELSNRIYGNWADNVIIGGPSGGLPDHMSGSDGNDAYYVNNSADVVDDHLGNNVIYTSVSYSLTPAPPTDFPARIVRLAASDPTSIEAINLTGDHSSQEISGNAGNNILMGMAGNDTITGGDGDDTLSGGDGNDTLNGNAGNDTLNGDAGADNLRGGAGNDTLNGGANGDRAWYDDALAGVTVNLATGVATSTVGTSAGIGTDQLISIESVTGGNFDDRITGGDGDDFLRGGAGNDWIDGGDSDDWLIGDDGNDQLFGSAGEDVLDALAGNDSLYGGADHDELFGYEGDDFLDGGADWDVMFGGLGNDIYVFDYDFGGVSDFISEQGGDGTDEVRASLSYTLGFDLENLLLTGTAVINGTGNELANTIRGNDAANAISGLAGADQLTGNGGADTLIGGSGDDTVIDTAANLNGDTITDLSAGDRIVISNATLAGFTFSLNGSTLTYSGGSLTLTGFAGQLQASAAAGGGVQLTVADARNDFNGDGRSDILWRNDNGTLTDWLGTASGGFTANAANAWAGVPTNWHVAATGDFNGDNRDDILWRSEAGELSDWLGTANGGFTDNAANAWSAVPTNWQVAGTGDFNGDGKDDILWRSEAGELSDWLGDADGGFTDNAANAFTGVPTNWQVAGTGDFNGDNKDDILWRHNDGTITNWLGQANGGFASNYLNSAAQVPADWHIAGTGDFNGDGKDYILWRHEDGTITDWLGTASGEFSDNGANAWAAVPTDWRVAGTGDFNGDGKDDILWRSEACDLTDWLGSASGGFTVNGANAYTGAPTDWHVQPNDLWM
jgi:Ca2+-binding RTX toxin-like protein